jgi:hypothetical protein
MEHRKDNYRGQSHWQLHARRNTSTGTFSIWEPTGTGFRFLLE